MKRTIPSGEPMRSVDHAWLRMEEPTNLMMITGVLLFDRPLDFERVRQVVERRLLSIPRFRQRVVPASSRLGRHRWVEDPEFDLGHHLVREALPAPGDEAALRELVSRWMSVPLDQSRPLWQAHVIDNFEGGSAVLWRLHHCIGDGIALMLVLLSLTDLEAPREPAIPGIGDQGGPNPLRRLFDASPISPETAKGHLERIMPEAVKLLTGPAEKLRSLSRWQKGGASLPAFGRLALRPPDPKSIFKGPLGEQKRAAWSAGIPLVEVDRLRRGLGGTVNDVLTAAVTGGLRRYLEQRGVHPHGLNFRAVVPVSLRPLEEMAALGNQFGLVFLSLPVGLGDPLARLTELRRRMGALKRSFEPVVALRVLGALGASPHGIQRLAVKIFGAKGTAVMTNVPGPREVLHLAGAPIRGFMFWVPQSGRLGMGISIASYAGEVRVGIATDEGLVADPETIVEGFHQELTELTALASEAGRA